MSTSADQGATPDRQSRTLSRTLVMQELARGAGATKPQIVHRTGLSRTTVAAVLTGLDREGRLIRNGHVASDRGRPAELLLLAQPPGFVGAVDLGHSHLTAAVATTDGELIADHHIEFDADASGPTSVATAAESLRQLMSEHQIDDLHVVALGVPGPLERRKNGSVHSGGVMSGWTDLEPVKQFQANFGSGVRMTLDNDAHLGAIGESAYGAARGIANSLYLKIGTGIGSGLILNNSLYRGGHGSAGEIGHVRVMDQGDLCRCGGRGCLETVASMTFARHSLQPIHGPNLTDDDIVELLRRNDPSTLRLFEDIGDIIGRVVAATASALDPEIIVVGSPILGSSPLTTAIEKSLIRYTQPFVVGHSKVVAGTLGRRAPVMGAVARATRTARAQSLA